MNWKKSDYEWDDAVWVCEATAWFDLFVQKEGSGYEWMAGDDSGIEKTLPKAKKAAEDKLVEMFRELGAALGYDVD